MPLSSSPTQQRPLSEEPLHHPRSHLILCESAPRGAALQLDGGYLSSLFGHREKVVFLVNPKDIGGGAQ